MWTIASWNVNSLKVRLPQVLQWLDGNEPDVLALQETKLQDESFPVQAFHEMGYRVVFSGQKTYNGVAIVSRKQAQALHTALPGFADPQKRVLCALVDEVCVLNLYVPNGSEVGSDKYAYKLDWLARLHDFAGELLQRHDKLILLGDFNITPTDADVHDPEKWRDQDPLQPAGTGRPVRTPCPRPHGYLPPVRTGTPLFFLVGLPRGRFCPQPRVAHRPDTGVKRAQPLLRRQLD